MVDDGYNYFSDNNTPLVMADWNQDSKSGVASDYRISDLPVQTISRDRLVQNQTYSESTQVGNPNKPIVLNNGVRDQIIIGFDEGKFA